MIDPAQGLDCVADIAPEAGRIALVSEHIPEGQADQVVKPAGRTVTPGLIDLHTHVFDGLNLAV